MPVPCNCCPVGLDSACALVGVQFTGVAETASQAGWNATNLALTADGDTTSTVNSGYTTTVGNTPSTTLRVEYTLSTPRNRVRGLKLWNQGGGILTDSDGLNHFTAEFYAGATLLTTATFQGANGAGPTIHTLPLGLELTGVDRVVLRTLDKQIGGAVAPLWRELQLLTFETVYACRRGNTLEWYDQYGNIVTNADVVSCDQPTPFVTPTLTMNGSAFGDDPSGTAENMCSVVPAPSSATGWALAGACYDPTTGAPSFTWTDVSTVEMSFGDNGNGQPSGAVFVSFTAAGFPTITWPTNLTGMDIGEQRLSNVFGGGHRARLTYVSGPPQSSASGTVRMNGGSTIAVHFGNVSAVAPIRFRLELLNA